MAVPIEKLYDNPAVLHSNATLAQATLKTAQELLMLSSVTLNCQVTKVVMNLGSQLSEL